VSSVSSVPPTHPAGPARTARRPPAASSRRDGGGGGGGGGWAGAPRLPTPANIRYGFCASREDSARPGRILRVQGGSCVSGEEAACPGRKLRVREGSRVSREGSRVSREEAACPGRKARGYRRCRRVAADAVATVAADAAGGWRPTPPEGGGRHVQADTVGHAAAARVGSGRRRRRVAADT
jgi:hypothetical protein